ncbi:hypothetical protein [Salaquimonas pukyongi]|uniref:hypothetical protein n=1 Tax=Salaquimonas pukyongi TaxID=2712698 RepID=UPI0012EC3D18|nr:hypothetical protein [Salaquimonas pukyongi]
MSISPDLMYAILSMDVYNRGYGEGIEGLGGLGASIGTATITQQSDTGVNDPEVAAGFYAVAYEWNGETVISYRGTDNDTFSSDPESGGSDVLNGWISGGGYPTGQSELAFEFYEAATGADAFDGIAQDVTLTGHSLGGGLAG